MIERTAEQKRALWEAYRLLAENFDEFLIVASMRADHAAIGTDMDVYWKGGFILAAGLADFARLRINYQRRPNVAPAKPKPHGREHHKGSYQGSGGGI